MTILGDPGPWAPFFPDRLIPDIIRLVVEVWSRLPAPGPDEGEVLITRALRRGLCAEKKARKLPFNIWTESEEQDFGTGKLLGRIDLRFVHGYLEDVYFAFECKRLNVPRASGTRSQAGAYVDEGMMRFVEGKYASGLDEGGMLAYVMDGKTSDAIASVDKAVRKRAEKLKLADQDQMQPCTKTPKTTGVRETTHSLKTAIFFIYHVFLTVSPSRPGAHSKKKATSCPPPH